LKRISFLIILVLFAPYVIAGQFNVTLDLARNEYLHGEPLEGKLIIEFLEPFAEDATVYASLGDLETNKTIKTLLDEQKISYNIIPEKKELKDPETEKTLAFTEPGSKQLAISLPKNTENITEISMDITGEPGSTLETPRLDFGDDGKIEWYYMGSLKEFGNFSKSSDLEESNEGEAYITKNMTGYCAMIRLPYSKHFKVYAKYAKVGSSGDIKATFLSVPSGDPTSGATGGSNTCDLEESSTYDWHSCVIEFPYVPTGDNLVCIYSESGEGQLYRMGIDSGEETLSSYTCPIGEDELCKLSSTTDFFIKVKGGVYDSALKETAKLTDWQTSPGAVARAIKHALDTSCFKLQCMIPLSVTANGTGSIKLHSLRITYIQDGILQVAKTLYDIKFVKAVISEINGVSLNRSIGQQNGSSASINESFGRQNGTSMKNSSTSENTEVPKLEVNLKGLFPRIPDNITDGESLHISVKIDKNVVAKDIIKAYSTELPSQKVKQQMIEAVIKNYQNLQTSYSELLDLTGLQKEIESARSSLQSITGNTRTEIQSKIREAIAQTPMAINRLSEQKGYPRVSESDIPIEIEGDAGKIVQMQREVVPLTTIEKYEVKYYNGTTLRVSLVTKDIMLKESKSNVDIYEVLPNVEIVPSVTPSEYVVDRRLVRWHYDTIDHATLSYIAYDNMLSVNDIKTIAVWEEKEAGPECVLDEDCGEDEICNAFGECEPKPPSKLPLGLVFGVGFSLLVGVAVFMLLKPLFKDKRQLGNVVSFIGQMKIKGYAKRDISEMLAQKGWKKWQISYAFVIAYLRDAMRGLLKKKE